jgi:hypothetical protein
VVEDVRKGWTRGNRLKTEKMGDVFETQTPLRPWWFHGPSQSSQPLRIE